MSPLLMLLLTGGALTGTGIAITAARISARPPSLAGVLAALDERTLPATAEPVAPWTRLVPRIPGAVPERDLAVLGWSRDRFLVTRVGRTLGYAVAGPALAATSGLLDLGLPITVPAVFTLSGAWLGWTGVARSVRTRAQDAREELRFALVSFLQQAGLLRQGGAGVATALSLPARLLADGWAMRRIADELARPSGPGRCPGTGWPGSANRSVWTS